MDPDFGYLEVWISDDPTFSTGDGELVGTLFGPGTEIAAEYHGDFLVYDQTYFIRTRAVDRSHNFSAYSAIVSAEVIPIVDTDLIQAEIDGANIKPGTIVASDKIVGNTITGGLIQALAIDSGKIQANAITSGHIQAGAVTAAKVSAASIDGTKLTADALNFKTGFGMELYAGILTTTSFWSGDGTSWNQRLEIGNTGAGDPVDEVRMFNNNSVVSMRHYTGFSGAILFNLTYSGFNFASITAFNSTVTDGNNHPVIGGGTPNGGRGKLKFVASPGSMIQARLANDSDYAPLACSALTQTSFSKFKQDIKKVGFDYKDHLLKANMRQWKRKRANLQIDKVKDTPPEHLLPREEWEKIQRAQGKSTSDADYQEAAKANHAAEVAQFEATANETHYGLVADDLPDFLIYGDGYSVGALCGFLWETVRQMDARIDALESEVVPE
jgi:hypothetical protein